MKIFKAERLFIKEVSTEDITDRVMAWFADEKLMKFYTNSKQKITRESLLNSIEEGKASGTNFTYGLFDNDTSIMFGTLKIGPIQKAHKFSDLVALIGDRNFLGVGLSVDAIKLGLKVAFEEYDVRKIIGGMYESNLASIKAYRAAGFLVEGRLKGHYLVDGKSEDRILVGCFNPAYFTQEEIAKVKENEHRYI